MKYFLLLFIFIALQISAQNPLKFDKKQIDAENNWVAIPMEKEGEYALGFIYLDLDAGLTLQYEGNFSIEKDGQFKRLGEAEKTNSMKIRLQPNNNLCAIIPDAKLKDLKVEKTPDWLKIYNADPESSRTLYSRGFMYNHHDQPAKALIYLEKADKKDPLYNGLQTELAYSYNALGKFDLAEKALQKAIVADSNNCYTYKELAYTYTKGGSLEKAITTFETMSKMDCKEVSFVTETAYNIAYEYYKKRDEVNFKKWKSEMLKWAKSGDAYSKNVAAMEQEWNKKD